MDLIFFIIYNSKSIQILFHYYSVQEISISDLSFENESKHEQMDNQWKEHLKHAMRKYA